MVRPVCLVLIGDFSRLLSEIRSQFTLGLAWIGSHVSSVGKICWLYTANVGVGGAFLRGKLYFLDRLRKHGAERGIFQFGGRIASTPKSSALRVAAELASRTHALLGEPLVIGSTKWTVSARKEHWRADEAVPISFNASWDIAACDWALH